MKRRLVARAILLSIAVAMAPACSGGNQAEQAGTSGLSVQESVRGSGRSRTEERSITAFTRLVVRTRAEVRLRIGSEPSLTVTTDHNLLPRITTVVEEGALVISSGDHYTTRLGMNVEVVTSSLQAVEFDASGEVILEGIDLPRLDAAIRGGGRLVGSGSTEELELDASSSGTAQLFDLTARRVKVTLRDTAVAEVTALEALDAHIGGSGSVVFDGDPVTLNVSSDATATGAVRPRYPPPIA